MKDRAIGAAEALGILVLVFVCFAAFVLLLSLGL